MLNRLSCAAIVAAVGLLNGLPLTMADTNPKAANNTPTAKNTKAPAPMQKLPKYNAVQLSGVGDLYISRAAAEEGVTVEADDSLLHLIKVSVDNKVLLLDLKNASEHTEAKITYHLYVKDLQKVTSNSTSTLYMTGPFKTDTLDVVMGGLGEANLDLVVNQLNIKIDGGAKIVAKGIAGVQNISINGAGEFDGTKLLGKSSAILVNGSGLAKLNVSDQLDIKAYEDAIVKYCGQPTVTKDTSGHTLLLPLPKNKC
jgi:hypothetical protein